jgi:hypothetical protein
MSHRSSARLRGEAAPILELPRRVRRRVAETDAQLLARALDTREFLDRFPGVAGLTGASKEYQMRFALFHFRGIPLDVGAAAYWEKMKKAEETRRKREAKRKEDRDKPINNLLSLDRDSIRFPGSTRQEVGAALEMLRPALVAGQFFIITAKEGHGKRHYTLGLEYLDDLIGCILDDGSVDCDASDQQIRDLLIDRPFTISRPANRGDLLRQARDNNGQYFPYLHTYECPKLTETLHRMGVFKRVDPDEYIDNCLCKAMESAGVPARVLEDLRASCIMRSIPRRKLKEVADKYKLSIELRTHGSHNTNTYGPADGFKVRLALFKQHYIHDFDTPFIGFAVRNYERLKERDRWWAFKEDSRRTLAGGMSSYKLLQLIVSLNDHLVPIDVSTHGIFKTQFHDKASREFATLEYPGEAVRPAHPDRFTHEEVPAEKMNTLRMYEAQMRSTAEGRESLQRLQRKVARLGLGIDEKLTLYRRHVPPAARIFLDFESTTDGDKHRAYLGCWAVEGSENIMYTTGDCPGLEFLDWILENYGSPIDEKTQKKVTIIAHNITYDAAFIMEHLQRLEIIERGTSIISGRGLYRTYDAPEGDWCVMLELKDSQKMIPGALSGFASQFNLPIQKEVMPYDMYTEDFIDSGGFATEEELSHLACYPELIQNLRQMGVHDPERGWDMVHYSRWYCQADVRLLMRGWKVFRDDTLMEVDVDVNYYPTTASLADAYITEQGCYVGVYDVSGVVREFISRCNVGGRVMCANNQPCIVNRPVADVDVTSLYPSAMRFGPGYLKGKPKPWHPGINLANVDGYFLKILVKRVPKRYPFPICRLPTKDEGNNWTNDLEGKVIYVDRFTLEDLVMFSEDGDMLEYDILQGYFYDEGRNTQIQTTIDFMFDKRLRLKALKSTAQAIYKLMMNAGYGRTGMKPVETKVTYCSGDKALAFLHNHHNHIKHFVDMPNGSIRYETWKPIDEHFNKQHISAEILSFSKRIMNKPMCLAHDLGIQIYYTDTDSVHIDADKVEELAVEYERRYGTKLIGTQMGQMHVDFDFGSCYRVLDGKMVKNDVKPVGEIVAERAIFLGKKSYIDQLVDEAGNRALHIRLKGIPMKCIVNKVNSDYGGDAMQMYEDMYNGTRMDFELGSGGHVMFRTNKDHTVVSQTMVRSLQFKNKENAQPRDDDAQRQVGEEDEEMEEPVLPG